MIHFLANQWTVSYTLSYIRNDRKKEIYKNKILFYQFSSHIRTLENCSNWNEQHRVVFEVSDSKQFCCFLDGISNYEATQRNSETLTRRKHMRLTANIRRLILDIHIKRHIPLSWSFLWLTEKVRCEYRLSVLQIATKSVMYSF